MYSLGTHLEILFYLLLEELLPELLYFGIFDGHGGSYAAEYLSEHLSDHLNFWRTQTHDLTKVLRNSFCDAQNLLSRHLAFYHIGEFNVFDTINNNFPQCFLRSMNFRIAVKRRKKACFKKE